MNGKLTKKIRRIAESQTVGEPEVSHRWSGQARRSPIVLDRCTRKRTKVLKQNIKQSKRK